MKRIEILRMKSPYRDDFVIEGFHFGGPRKTLAIVGSMRGDEIQQLFVASQIIKNLSQVESQGLMSEEHGVLVIPTGNPFSLNVHKRFWAMDNTDINRMFPGYDEGETTQRIAAAIFESVRGYEWGVQLASYYLSGNFAPHVRLMHTGYEDTSAAEEFGLPLVYCHEPTSYDTAVLNYNWQVFETKAYSLYSGSTDVICHDMAKQSWLSVLRFARWVGACDVHVLPGARSYVFADDALRTVMSDRAGILYARATVGQTVRRNDLLAKVLDPFTGQTLQEIISPADGVIFFAHTKNLIHQHSRVFQVLTIN